MGAQMTGVELRDLFASHDFEQELAEMSCYLASIMQERPIVYLLAKHLWKKGNKFVLERVEHQDLRINGKRVEFKFNYDRCQHDLKRKLEKLKNEYGNDLKAMWERSSNSWRGAFSKIYEDVIEREPDIFVWIICSRDLGKFGGDEIKCFPVGTKQCRFNAKNPYGAPLTYVDQFLDLLQVERNFAPLNHEIQTDRIRTDVVFPSTYHFRICDFGACQTSD